MASLHELVYEAGELTNPDVALQSNWVGWANRAIREIANEVNWTFTHDRRQYTLLSGDTSVSLGPDYKCLSDEDSPISVSYSSGGNTYNLPVRVLSREEVERYVLYPWINQFLSQPVPGGYTPIRVVFLERNNGGETRLHIPPQFNLQVSQPYNVSAFYYPAALKLGSDHNAITDDPNLVSAIINRMRSLSFEAKNPADPRVKAAMELRQDAYDRAHYADVDQKFSGRSLRM